jgi:hypothetical protein
MRRTEENQQRWDVWFGLEACSVKTKLYGFIKYMTKTESPWTCHPERGRGIYFQSAHSRSLGYARDDKLKFCRVL